MMAITMHKIATRLSLQKKKRDDDSNSPTISKMINSNSVKLRVNVIEKISWIEMCLIS